GHVAERLARAHAVALHAPHARAVDEHATVTGREHAGDRHQERRLARAVLADEADDLAGRRLQAEVVDHDAATALHAQPFDAQDHDHLAAVTAHIAWLVAARIAGARIAALVVARIAGARIAALVG